MVSVQFCTIAAVPSTGESILHHWLDILEKVPFTICHALLYCHNRIISHGHSITQNKNKSFVDKHEQTVYTYKQMDKPSNNKQRYKMTKEAAIQRLKNRISKMSDDMIIAVLTDMAKPWDKYSHEERMVKAYLYDQYEQRNGEEAVDILLDTIEAIEESRR